MPLFGSSNAKAAKQENRAAKLAARREFDRAQKHDAKSNAIREKAAKKGKW